MNGDWRKRSLAGAAERPGGGPPLVELELEELCRGADRIRSALCGDRADLCTIVNGAQRPVR